MLHDIIVVLPGEFHGQRSLAGYSPWGCKELDITEQLTHTHIIEVTGIQYSDSQFLKVMFHLQLLQHTGHIPCVTQFIFVAYFMPDSLYLLTPSPYITLSLPTGNRWFVLCKSASFCYSH